MFMPGIISFKVCTLYSVLSSIVTVMTSSIGFPALIAAGVNTTFPSTIAMSLFSFVLTALETLLSPVAFRAILSPATKAFRQYSP